MSNPEKIPNDQEAQEASQAADAEEFRRLLDATLKQTRNIRRGEQVRGRVVAVHGGNAVVDVGAKVEATIPLDEFSEAGLPAPEAGDEIEALVTRSNAEGIRLSVLEGRRREDWARIEEARDSETTLTAHVEERIKGGFRVSIGAVRGFLPFSEADPDPRSVGEELVGQDCEVMVIEARRKPENVVVSRRRPIERAREEQRRRFFETAQVGDRVRGTVRRMADFGAFVDVGGMDALLHVSDIAWQRLERPDQVLSIGQQVEAEIVRLEPETGKVSISMKALQPDPWAKVAETYEPGMRITGTVRRLLDYGAIVELEPGIEGLIHRSELSWTRRDVRPDQVLAEGDVVDVQVLEVDPEQRRIRLSLKAVTENPWQAWLADHPVGSRVKGKIRNITDFGLFVAVSDELDGLVHMDNLSWEKPGPEAIAEYSRGQEVECVVLGVDVERQRISLGIKQLSEDPLDLFVKAARRGESVNGRITEAKPNGFVVELAPGVQAWLPRREVPRDQEEPKVGDEVEAKVIEADRKRRRVTLSVRRHLLDEERAAVRQYTQQQKDDTPSPLALEIQRKLLGKG